MAVAVLLHFFLLSTFAWLFVDGLHLYRNLTELRNVNLGTTRSVSSTLTVFLHPFFSLGFDTCLLSRYPCSRFRYLLVVESSRFLAPVRVCYRVILVLGSGICLLPSHSGSRFRYLIVAESSRFLVPVPACCQVIPKKWQITNRVNQGVYNFICDVVLVTYKFFDLYNSLLISA